MKNGGYVRRLESAKCSHDFSKRGKSGLYRRSVNLDVYRDQNTTEKAR